MVKSKALVNNILLGVVVVVLVVIVVLCVTRKNEGFYMRSTNQAIKADCFHKKETCNELRECCKKLGRNSDTVCGSWMKGKKPASKMTHNGRKALVYDKKKWGEKCKYE